MTDPEATGSEATGPESTGSEATGSESTGSESTGSEAAGSEATGSEATGSSQSTGKASSPRVTAASGTSKLGRAAGIMMVTALVMAAFNLRPVVASVGPLLAEIRAGLGMGGVVAGLLTALPAVCFVAFGSLAPRLLARTFAARLLWIALAVTTVGLALRPFMPGTATFVLLSSVALGGIGLANIVMPVIVRRVFPDRVGLMTGVYSMALALGGALAAAVTVPLTNALGGDWRLGLGFWAIPAGLALVMWFGVARWVRLRGRAPQSSGKRGDLRITRSRTAWAVAIVFGLQSTHAYVTMGWVPQIYRDAGLSPGYAGVLLALIPAIGVPTSFLVPTLAGQLRSQGWLAVVLSGLGIAGYLGLWIMPATVPWLWVIVLGLSQSMFPLALTLIVLRAKTPAGTIALSSFGQSVGYLISIPGPIVVGALYGATGGWDLALGLLIVLSVPQAVFGVLAGRPRYVEDDLVA